jgi:hypothetical protein
MPQELSDHILFESDNTCCVCQNAMRSVQVHHIDEDPSNNDPANLAVLCLECHNKTQISGGFGKRLTPSLVRKYRNEWHQIVRDRRAVQRGHVAASAPKRAAARMTPEQARQHAQRLREMYTMLFQAVENWHNYALQMAEWPSNESFDERKTRLDPMWMRSAQLVASALPQIRVEPGAKAVSERYDEFVGRFIQYTESIERAAGPATLASALARTTSIHQRFEIDKAKDSLQSAMQAHIARVDRGT